jgi:hypothetical protein
MSFSGDVETQYRSTWWGSRHTEAIFLTNVGEGTVPRRNRAIPNRSRIEKTVFSVVPYFTNGSMHKAQQDVTVTRDASILLASTSQTVVCTRRSRTSLSPETQAFFWLLLREFVISKWVNLKKKHFFNTSKVSLNCSTPARYLSFIMFFIPS